MIAPVVMFAAGAAAGIYGTIKARRLAYRLSTPGLADQAAALKLGVTEFRREFEAGLNARRVRQLEALGASLHSIDTDTPTITTLGEEPDRADS